MVNDLKQLYVQIHIQIQMLKIYKHKNKYIQIQMLVYNLCVKAAASATTALLQPWSLISKIIQIHIQIQMQIHIKIQIYIDIQIQMLAYNLCVKAAASATTAAMPTQIQMQI